MTAETDLSTTPQSTHLISVLLSFIAPHSAKSDLAKCALDALTNLCQDPKAARSFVEVGGLPTILNMLISAADQHDEACLMLLANATVPDEGSRELSEWSSATGQDWTFLLNLASEVSADTSVKDPHAHVASILTNLTRQSRARAALLNRKNFMDEVATQLLSPNVIRRRGYSTGLRNLMLGAKDDDSVRQVVREKGALGRILDHLCGSTGPREADNDARAALAEAVWILAQSDLGAKVLWEVGAPEKLHKGYETEEIEAVCRAMEGTAGILLSGLKSENSGLP